LSGSHSIAGVSILDHKTAQRLLKVTLDVNLDSIQTYHIDDLPCPSNITGASCLTVYGNFSVQVNNYAGIIWLDPKPLADRLSQFLETAISTRLQFHVDQAVAVTAHAFPMTIIGASEKNRPDEAMTSSSNNDTSINSAQQPTGAAVRDGSSGVGSGAGKTVAAVITLWFSWLLLL
jgi:hypothetical protein